MSTPQFQPFTDRFVPNVASDEAARQFYETMRTRRSVRMFADTPVSQQTIEWIVRAACTAPSGANKQPWRFVCVSNPAIKRDIRLGAEEEERAFYAQRGNEKWLADLAPLGTDENKAFLETAPWLIAVFKLVHDDDDSQVYYINESVGIAVGLLLAAAHHAGLATLTHTPSPMKFLANILKRPDYERPYVLIPVGYPTDDCVVPVAAMQRKPLEQSMVVMA